MKTMALARSKGRPGNPHPIRRILCMKVDHIGDILIAAPALMALRKSFPQAHITLLCAPWNVGLARRLRIADEIHAISFFSQNSLEDEDRGAVEGRRATLVSDLQGLALAPFDLAIDLRRDEDTRELLKLFDARVLAGFGDLAVFSYLDVALPFTRHGPAAGVTQLRLTPADFNGTMAHPVTASGLHLVTQLAEIQLTVETDTVWSPSEDGTPDNRMLGVAFNRIDARSYGTSEPSAEIQLGRDGMIFGAGWLDWEGWGRWSNAPRATVTLRFAATSATVELRVRVQGHTSDKYPAALVRLIAGGGDNIAEHRFTRGEEAATLSLVCQPRLLRPRVVSEPFLMRGGRYGGTLRVNVARIEDWQRLILTIHGARLGHVLAKLELPESIDRAGDLTFPFEVEIKDGAEPISIQIASERPDEGNRLAISALELDWLQGGYPHMPLVHLEAQLMDLAAMVALRYSPAPIIATSEVAARLTHHRAGSSAAPAVARLNKHKKKGWPFRRTRRIIGIGIGANKETKLWPLAHFADLCRRLLAETGYDLAFVGGPNDAAPIATLIEQLGGSDRVIDLSASCKIEDLGEVLSALDGFIGLDTGTTHFAGRIGLPTVSIFGAAHDAHEWGPVGPATAWIAADIACAGCFKATAAQCGIGVLCMSGLDAEAVWPLVETVLLAPRRRADARREP